MADRPIIFSAAMIMALIEGRKTQTRRVLRLGGRYPEFLGPRGCEADPTCWGWETPDGYFITVEGDPEDHAPGWRNGWRDWIGAYAPGDRLWVREAWRAMDGQDAYSGAVIEAQCREAGYREPWSPIQYEADGARLNWIRDPHTFGTQPGRYRHARFMPRWASRLTLTVTNVRVQRLGDMTDEDAVAEGCERDSDGWRDYQMPTTQCCGTARDSYRTLWNTLHGPGAWEANPWVAALTFRPRICNIDGEPK